MPVFFGRKDQSTFSEQISHNQYQVMLIILQAIPQATHLETQHVIPI